MVLNSCKGSTLAGSESEDLLVSLYEGTDGLTKTWLIKVPWNPLNLLLTVVDLSFYKSADASGLLLVEEVEQHAERASPWMHPKVFGAS